MSRRRAIAAAALAALLAGAAGCNIFGPLLYLTAPRQIKRAEHALPKGRIAILVEYAQAGEENPVFHNALLDKLEEIFRERKVADDIVPMEEVVRLRRRSPEFASWGLQKVARELDAVELIYVRVESLRLRATPEYPIIEPRVVSRVRVISTEQPSSAARVFPGSEEPDGREITRARAFREADQPLIIDEEAAKLGRDLAHLVAMPFYDVDTEEAIPWEQ